MGLWYRTKTFKKVDIIKVRVETYFNINTQTRYSHWDEPEMFVTYAHYKGKLRITDSVIGIEGTYPNYKVKIGNQQYVDSSSEAFVLIFEKDSGYYNHNLEIPNYSLAWNKTYTLHTFSNYTLNASNDFTFILPRNASTVLIFPTFKYLNIPLGLMGYYFDFKKVNNRSWKVIPYMRYAHKWDTYTYTSNSISLNLTNSSNILVNCYFGMAYTTTTPLTINMNFDGANNIDTIEQSNFMPSTNNTYTGVIPREYQIYTNQSNKPSANLSINYSGGSGISAKNTVIRVLRVGDYYVPYTDCEIEVLVLWVG
nr:MAG TPA: hypothetical protein [Ackermannviridae sp.]DAX66626.1 MAG TPA: hypothetical protein [Bacteriophage sp.]